ncbi:MAG: helix-turn-helix transcriptional regulator [Clostridiales bacterium]|jgi:transcriptional regulator with XRE-family HTH domain|nr:helix-turn-helix transcriptional regulator [Clostridiales bacterium]
MICIDKIGIGKKIKETRKNQNISRAALSESAAITEQYLGEIERGKRIPSLEVYVNLVNTLQISSDVCLRSSKCNSLHYIYNEILEIVTLLQKLSQTQVSMILSVIKILVSYMEYERT